MVHSHASPILFISRAHARGKFRANFNFNMEKEPSGTGRSRDNDHHNQVLLYQNNQSRSGLHQIRKIY